MLRRIEIGGYRSVRKLSLDLRGLTVITGGNGVGKTNLYRSLLLIHAAATGTLARAVATEGGMRSMLWAGAHNGPAATEVALSAEVDTLSYTLRLGLPGPSDPALALDPVVREEAVSARVGDRTPLMLQRKGPGINARAPDGSWQTYPNMLLMAETALSRLRDPRQFPELDSLQRRFAGWRFYHGFRIDESSPLRQPQVAVCSPSLDADGANLAATLATTMHLAEGGRELIEWAIHTGFPGSKLEFVEAAGRHAVALRSPEFDRPFAAHEMSDGTLRYLCMTAALCAYRLPPFIALNEPEASLHAELIAPLAAMIIKASQKAQIVVVTHSMQLADILERQGTARRIALGKENGETVAIPIAPRRPTI